MNSNKGPFTPFGERDISKKMLFWREEQESGARQRTVLTPAWSGVKGAGFFSNTCAKVYLNLLNLAFAKYIRPKAYRVNWIILYKWCVWFICRKKLIACFMNQSKLPLLLIRSSKHPYFHVNSVYNCVQGAFYNKCFLLHVWLTAVPSRSAQLGWIT